MCLIVTKVPVALAGRVRHAETETTFTREEACYTHRSLETGGTSPRATWGSTRVCQEAEGSGDMGKRLYCSFLGKNWRGKVKRFRVGEFASFQWTLGENGCCYLSGTWSQVRAGE